jgi:hypothetical protein
MCKGKLKLVRLRAFLAEGAAGAAGAFDEGVSQLHGIPVADDAGAEPWLLRSFWVFRQKNDGYSENPLAW